MSVWRTSEGTTGRLLQLCLGYYAFYVVYGVAVKYFQNHAAGFPGMTGLEFLVYSTVGGSVVALFVCLGLRWYRLESVHRLQWGRVRIPSEWLYIVPSGICTAVVIPTTTLMYSLPISVMVAMVIMRGAIIIVGRLVDEVQIRQGLLRKRVYGEENAAIVFALLAVATTILLPASLRAQLDAWLGHARSGSGSGQAGGNGAFDFVHSPAALTILAVYLLSYSIRIYIMNYFKNTRPRGMRLDNKGFFAVEQMAAFVTLVVASAVLLLLPAASMSASGDSSAAAALGSSGDLSQLALFQRAFHDPRPQWGWAALAGSSFGIVAFFSVFIFMFKGRTATFAGLVNRITSLVAGTTATLAFHWGFGGPRPAAEDWLALVFILVAVGFLTRAERRRTAELVAAAELAPRTHRSSSRRA